MTDGLLKDILSGFKNNFVTQLSTAVIGLLILALSLGILATVEDFAVKRLGGVPEKAIVLMPVNSEKCGPGWSKVYDIRENIATISVNFYDRKTGEMVENPQLYILCERDSR